MALIQFVNNYEDLSTDRGYQFKFHCDRCGNGHMSEFQTSIVGTAGSVLRIASDLFGGWFSSAGHSSYEIQRAVGGGAHDKALQQAVEQGKMHFKQCSRCGKWVCPDVCWNHEAGQCEECAPDFAEEFASSHAQAKAAAASEQLFEKARKTDYVSAAHMGARSVAKARSECGKCGTTLGGGVKFCPECGAKA